MAARDVTGQLLERLTRAPITETYQQLADEMGASLRMVKWSVAKLRREGRVTVTYTEHDGVSRDRSSRVITLIEVTR